MLVAHGPLGDDVGAFGTATLKRHRYHLTMRCKDSGLLTRFICRCACPRAASCVRDGDLIPLSTRIWAINMRIDMISKKRSIIIMIIMIIMKIMIFAMLLVSLGY